MRKKDNDDVHRHVIRRYFGHVRRQFRVVGQFEISP